MKCQMGKSIVLVITAAHIEGQVMHQLTVTVTFKIPIEIDALLNSILSDTVPKNENRRNRGVDSIVPQMDP